MAGGAVTNECSTVTPSFSTSDRCLGKLAATSVTKRVSAQTQKNKNSTHLLLDVHGQNTPVQINKAITNLEKHVSYISLYKSCLCGDS